jgi:hypothetical protein
VFGDEIPPVVFLFFLLGRVPVKGLHHDCHEENSCVGEE